MSRSTPIGATARRLAWERRSVFSGRVRWTTISGAVALLALGALSSRPVRADAVVGTGAAASCTESALDAALAAGGSITFNCNLNPVSITVTSQKTVAVNTSLNGGGLITLNGGGATRVFVVNSGATLALANMTISHGSTGSGDNGGAIYNSSGGTLTVTNGTFSDNNAGGSGHADGGAIYNSNGGTLTVTNSTFADNHAIGFGLTAGGTGGAIFNDSGTLTVTTSTFSNNTANCSGGAIANNAGTLAVTTSTFAGNVAYFADGGAIANNAGTLTVTNSTFAGNVEVGAGGNGGAIFNSHAGVLTVTNSTFAGNVVDEAAQPTGGSPCGNSLVTGGNGGAIFNCGTLTVTNSTFSNNTAYYGGNTIFNLTVATFTNTIVFNSTAASARSCAGTITDGGHNLDLGTSCKFRSDMGSLNKANPLLDQAGLANNGGPTQTIALQAGSPAINAGDEIACAAPPVNNIDQRGYVRPGTVSVNCSIGAYEYNSAGPPGCCQCPTSCAAPINGSCGGCIGVVGATCGGGSLCVLYTPTPTPTVTPTATNTPATNDCCQCADFCSAPIAGTCGGCTVVFGATCESTSLCVLHTPTRTPTPKSTPTNSPTVTATAVVPGIDDCCQCADFCSAPVAGTCGGCAMVLGASCTAGSVCNARTQTSPASATRTPPPTATWTTSRTSTVTVSPTHVPTQTLTSTPIASATATYSPTSTPTAVPTNAPMHTPTSTSTGLPTNTPTQTPTITRTATPSTTIVPPPTPTMPPTSTPRPCVGDCNGTHAVAVNDIITLVNIALGNALPSACPHGVPSGAEVDIALIIQAVNNVLTSCAAS